MSFIDKFLDVTTNLPREIVRLLKLYKFVEERSRNINESLKNIRIKYLKDLKEKNQEEENIFKITHDKKYKELLNLSDYKQSLINELKYILEYNFLKKIEPIIEEGQKECQEQLLTSNMNLPYSLNTYQNSNYNKVTTEEKSISEFNEKKKKNDKMLGNKTNRQNKNKVRRRNYPEYNEGMMQNDEEHEVFCTCKRQSFGPMIACEICGKWFHFECVGIDEDNEPENWFCAECTKKNNNNNINNNVKKKKKKH